MFIGVAGGTLELEVEVDIRAVALALRDRQQTV
jgi:hypothetical protein